MKFTGNQSCGKIGSPGLGQYVRVRYPKRIIGACVTEYHGSWQRYGEGRVKVFIQFSRTVIILAFIDAQKTVTAIY